MSKRQRDITGEVQKQLANGRILGCEKTKVGIGKRNITIGKYRTAVITSKKYAMYLDKHGSGGETVYFTTAIEAAEYFIDYVGRDMAWDSLPPSVRAKYY